MQLLLSYCQFIHTLRYSCLKIKKACPKFRKLLCVSHVDNHDYCLYSCISMIILIGTAFALYKAEACCAEGRLGILMILSFSPRRTADHMETALKGLSLKEDSNGSALSYGYY